MNDRDDIAILRLVRENPEKGMVMLIERYYGKVLKLCYSFVRDGDESKDLAQEIFIKLLTSLERFEGRSRLSTWIYRISVNTCIDAVRKMKRNMTIPISAHHAVSPQCDDHAADEASEIVRDAIDRLPLRYRTMVILRELEGKSYREMAEITGCSVGTVESRLYRGREMLRKLMEPGIRRMTGHEL